MGWGFVAMQQGLKMTPQAARPSPSPPPHLTIPTEAQSTAYKAPAHPSLPQHYTHTQAAAPTSLLCSYTGTREWPWLMTSASSASLITASLGSMNTCGRSGHSGHGGGVARSATSLAAAAASAAAAAAP